MLVYLCIFHLHSHPSYMDSFLDLSWSAETFIAIVLAKAQPSCVIPWQHMKLCWPQPGWEWRASDQPASSIPSRIRLPSTWSGDKPASLHCSEPWSMDPAICCCDVHSPESPYPSSLKPLSHTQRKSMAEAFSEFCHIGAAPKIRLGGTKFAYSGLTGSI